MLTALKTFRRDLHQIPELGFALQKTTAYLENVLAPLCCEVTHPAPSAVCAYFDAGRLSTIAFRADMDALPVEEATGAAYASTHPGRMHACGHDGHMSMLLGLALTAHNRLASLKHNVLLIFEPAEETTGGAKLICESGVLERYHASAIFGIHLWPCLPAGALYTRPGALMAQTGIVTIEIHGKSAHVARAAQGADALYAGVELLHRAYEAVENAAPKKEPRLLKFGVMQSGTAENALSAHTSVRGTLRVFDTAFRARIHEALCAIARDVEKSTGCRVELSLSEGYPPVLNDDALYERVMAQFGTQAPQLLGEPSLTGEDFSFFQMRVPGVFFFLGTGGTPPLHAADFDFDEAVLQQGLSFYERLLTLDL